MTKTLEERVKEYHYGVSHPTILPKFYWQELVNDLIADRQRLIEENERLKKLLTKATTCQRCGGDGYYMGGIPGKEPVQIQCDACYGAGVLE